VIDSWACGHLALALDVARFADPDTFSAGLKHLEDVVRDTPKLSPSDSILVPGEPEQRTRADREQHGIPVAASVRASLAAFADEIGIAAPDSLR
jgi:LDH2 family malate/lactate/ureidoglycolate dehydrogenase